MTGNGAEGGDVDASDDPERSPPAGVRIRTADPDDRVAVARVLDGAMLRTTGLPERLQSDDVLLAVTDRERDGAGDGAAETVVGAAVLETRGERRHLEAVAVRQERRDRGIGSALVARAVADAGSTPDVSRLVAEFDPGLRPFYEGLGFTVEPVSEDRSDRLRGTRPVSDA